MAKPPLTWKYDLPIGLHGLFTNEKTLCDFVEDNIESFTFDIFREPLVSYKREFALGKWTGYSGSPNRVDFRIETANRVAFIEVKNQKPKLAKGTKSKKVNAIGQILSYGAQSEDVTDLIILAPYFDSLMAETIAKYELPIKMVLLTNDTIGIWSKEMASQYNSGEIQVVSNAVS